MFLQNNNLHMIYGYKYWIFSKKKKVYIVIENGGYLRYTMERRPQDTFLKKQCPLPNSDPGWWFQPI